MGLNFGQNLFPPRGELVNYDYLDVVARTGYLSYYVSRANNGTYVVTTNPDVSSETIGTTSTTNSETATINSKSYFRMVAKTIDLTFNNPLNLNGNMFFNVPIAHKPGTALKYMLLRLSAFHYDGSTETAIGAEITSQEYSMDTDENNEGVNHAVPLIVIDTNGTIHFKIGENLRVKLEVWDTNNGGGARPSGFAHDPANRLDTTGEPTAGTPPIFITTGVGTQQIWLLPSKLDI